MIGESLCIYDSQIETLQLKINTFNNNTNSFLIRAGHYILEQIVWHVQQT